MGLKKYKNALRRARNNQIYPDCLKKPVDKKTVLLEAGQGKHIDGNVFAFLRCLQEPQWSGYRCVVSVTKETKKAVGERLQQLGYSARTVVRNSAEYKEVLATAGILITDNSFPPYFIKRVEQVYLNTWHGTPLKRLGRADIVNATSLGNVQKNFLMADYLLFPNHYTRQIMMKDYMIERLYRGTAVVTDYPRNDALHDAARREKVRREYGLVGKRIIAYMPTWRGTGRSADAQEQARISRQIIEEIEAGLGEDELLYVNLHFLIGNRLDLEGLTKTRFFPAELETYDFLSVCDVLISDYSSVMMDFAQLGRPIIMYMYDYETYRKEKGFYFDIRTLPFRKAYDMPQLQDELREALDGPAAGAYTLDPQFVGSGFGSATRRMLDLLFGGGAAGEAVSETGGGDGAGASAGAAVDDGGEGVAVAAGEAEGPAAVSAAGEADGMELIRCQGDPLTRLVYVGDLEDEATRHLTAGLIDGLSRAERQKTVIAFESEVKDETVTFLQGLDPEVDFLRCIAGGAIRLQEYVYLNLHRNHGLCSRGANAYLQREFRRLFACLGCGQMEFLSTNIYERVETLALAEKTAFHRVPLFFYRRLNDVFYKHPGRMEKVVGEYDTVISYPQDYGLEWIDGESGKGFYARVKGLKARMSGSDFVLSGTLTVRSPIPVAPAGLLQISSKVYEDVFCYSLETKRRGESSQSQAGGQVWTGKYDLRCSVPAEETGRWYVSNMVSIGLTAAGWQLMVPLLSGGGRLLRGRLTDLTGTGKVCEIKEEFKYYRLMIRERNVTDALTERMKLALAFGLHLVTPRRKPVVLYEKNCNSYEESGSVLYEKLVEDGYKNVRFILNRSYPHPERIDPKYRKYIVDQFSLRHYYNLFAAGSLISSEALGHALEKGSTNGLFRNFIMDGSKNYVFLQHGVMYMVSLDAGQRAFFRKGEGKGKHRVVVSSELEAEHFTTCTNYTRDDIYVCGLLKFDRSVRQPDADRIVIMPTWRPWEFVQGLDDVRNTGYYRMLRDMVDSVPEHLRENLIVLPHPLIAEQFANSSDDPVLRYCVRGQSYDSILQRTRVLITDYSSISYDAFYRGCRVVFYWKDKELCMKEYGDAHLMLTEDLAFGPVCYDAQSLAREVPPTFAQEQTEEEKRRYGRIVTWHDGKNTSRFIEMARADGIL